MRTFIATVGVVALIVFLSVVSKGKFSMFIFEQWTCITHQCVVQTLPIEESTKVDISLKKI